jgi:divalent metal cation (Fe/Co/Zn/Cd) transporter
VLRGDAQHEHVLTTLGSTAMKIATQRKSSVLASNAVHHRVDSLTSIVALLTIGGAHVFADASWLDPVGGLIISVMVIKAGWGNTKVSLLELADVSVDEDVIKSVRKATSKAILSALDSNEIEIRNVQGIKSGQNYLMEVELTVPGSWSVDRIRLVEKHVREMVRVRIRNVKRLKVRFVPQTVKESGFTDEFVAPDVSPRSSPEPEEEANGINGILSPSSGPKEGVHRRN